MMKRILILLLAITFIVPFSSAVYGEEGQEISNGVYAQQTKMLKALGIWDSVRKDPNEEITRGDFAVIVMNVLGVSGLKFGDVSFLDVDKSREDYSAIAFVKSYGVMNGFSDYVFDPDRIITYNEAIKTLLSAMGYDILANGKGGYPGGYLIQASTLGFNIFEGNLTREKAADMLVDALDVYILSAVKIEMPDERISYSAENKETILSAYHNIAHVKGMLTDNGLTSLSGKSVLSDGRVCIGNEFFVCNDTSVRYALGSDLDFYYKEIDNKNTVLWWSYVSKNKPIVIKSDDLATILSSFSKTQIVYYEDNRLTDVDIDPRASFIYNEIAYPEFTVEDLKIKNGTLTLYDGNGDGKYDVIFADVYRSFRVKSTDNAKEIFRDDFNQILDINEYEKVEILNVYDVLIESSSIAVNDVLSAFESKNKEYLRIRVSNGKDNLTYQSVKNEEPKIYTFGDKDYSLTTYLQEQISKNNANLDELKIGEKYRVYVDFNNDIAAFDLSTKIASYAYFIAAKTNGRLSKETIIRVILDNGQDAVLPLADKVYVNKEQQMNASDILNLSDLKDDEGHWSQQLIKIKTDSKGCVYDIETAPKLSNSTAFKNVGFDPNRFSMVFENSSAYYYSSGRNMIGASGKHYSFTPDTVGFIIPPDGSIEYIETFKGAPSNELSQTYMCCYDADASYGIGAIVIKLSENVGTTDKTRYEKYLYIVEGISEVLNDDGDVVKQIKGFSHSIEWYRAERQSGVIPSDIKVGDIVRLALDKKDRITRCTKILSTDPRPAPNAFNLADTTRTRASYDGSTSVAWGYLVGIGVNSLTISTDEVGGSIIHIPFYSSETTFIEFDVKNKTCKTITKAQIILTSVFNDQTNLFDVVDKNTMILATTSSSGAYDIIVMKFDE